MIKKTASIIIFLVIFSGHAQVVLNANGKGNTYEEITAVLAPGYNPIEVPDCGHTSYGRHIDEIFDNDLSTYVFRFFIHTSIDNDRCMNFDRQRNEIKSYSNSPDNLLGIQGEIVVYKWKFKLDKDFQPSPSFTHIHQLKSVGGALASMPMYTITLRKGTPDRLELRYAETDRQVTLKQTDLSSFKGTWVEVTETIQYDTSGYYAIQMKKVGDNSILFEYENNSLVNWRPEAEFVRPKWGIYRSLNSPQDLRDEVVLYANFSVEEMNTLAINEFQNETNDIIIYPNPSNDSIIISEKTPNSYQTFEIVNQLGQVVNHGDATTKKVDISTLPQGIYLVIFRRHNKKIATKKIIIN